MKLLLLSEGGRDLGAHDGSRAGAVRVLSRRVLEQDVVRRPLKTEEIAVDRLPRLNKLSGPRSETQRMSTAWLMARALGCRSLAVVVDRDRDADRLRSWATARDAHTEASSISIGVAVETVEAWLLADEKGLNLGLGVSPPHPRCAAPENFSGAPSSPNHPKTEFLRRASAATQNAETPYDAVAEHSELAQVEARCPSFKRFADELRVRAK